MNDYSDPVAAWSGLWYGSSDPAMRAMTPQERLRLLHDMGALSREATLRLLPLKERVVITPFDWQKAKVDACALAVRLAC